MIKRIGMLLAVVALASTLAPAAGARTGAAAIAATALAIITAVIEAGNKSHALYEIRYENILQLREMIFAVPT
ncbi:hypothetical protein BA187_13535 [Serratia marcescens]|nr:hypothetical protein BA187_13535 [Serratia marcescens]